MAGYVYQRVEHSKITSDAEGKVIGSRSVFTHETDENGNFKEPTREDYVLNGNRWVPDNNNKQIEDKKALEEKETKTPTTSEKNGKFLDGDILVAERNGFCVYAVYADDTSAYWVLKSYPNPIKDEFIYESGKKINFSTIEGVTFEDFKRASREDAFAVEKFIEKAFGYKWDWRNKEIIKV